MRLVGERFRIRGVSVTCAALFTFALSQHQSLAQSAPAPTPASFQATASDTTVSGDLSGATVSGDLSGATGGGSASGGTVSGELQTVEVVATSPLGAGTSSLNVPTEVQSVSSTEIQNLNQENITQDLARRTPGVDTSDAVGSPLTAALNFRGQTASPVPGTPQGLAVYMNGVRINEAYGDIVNWDAIPTIAIDQAQIVTGNPIFGLNALAGAVAMTMKNGFTWQGTEVSLQGGMDWRSQGSLQYGYTKGNWAYYFAFEGLGTNGYRYFGQSDVERGYGDIGYRAEGNEVHLSVNAAVDGLGVAGTTPLALVQQNPWASWTTPQETNNQIGMITLSDQSNITSTLQFNANAYLRSFHQEHTDGNISEFYHCAAALPDLCNLGQVTTLPDPDPTQPDGQPMGEIDRNHTRTISTGTTLQLTDTDKILDHNNHFTAGVSVDHGWTHFSGWSELGTLPSDLVVQGYGEFITQPNFGVAPVSLSSQNTYLGVYVLDDFDVTDKLTLHVGARFNDAQINLNDELGTSLTSSNNFNRINPVAGVTYKITPELAAYASYSEANRAPTPLELGCSNPAQPCMIDNFLVSDPPLKQVVARTVEAGLKGDTNITKGPIPGRLTWSVSAYRTENLNDIMSVPSEFAGFGTYVNAGDTLRQGVDLGATYTAEKWSAYANYSYIQATFLTPVMLSSPNNPLANADGNIFVMPGDNIPGIPRHKFKIGFDYTLMPHWTVGADLVYQSSQWYFGDEINALGPLPGFVTLNLRTSYQIDKNVQIFGLINNATNNRYYTYGALFETDSTLNQNTGGYAGLFNSSNPRAVTISPPFEALVGLKFAL